MELKLLNGFRTGARPPIRPVAPSAGLAEVRAYWEGLRCGGDIPARADLDPRGMSGTLDRVFIAERIGAGLVRIRIAGSTLHDIAGLDLRGLPLSCLFQPDARPRLSTLIERVFSNPIAAELHIAAEQGVGRPNLAGRMMLLPLLDTDGSRTLTLGCISFTGGVGRAPRRFGILRAVEENLITAPDHSLPHAPRDRREPPVAAAPVRPPHLRLAYSAN